MERVYSFLINGNQYLFFIKVVNHILNTAEYITTFIEWDFIVVTFYGELP